jgi:hypothetical protein
MTKFQMSTSWEELDVAELPNGIRARKYSIGSTQGAGDAPTVFMVEFPPVCYVAAHTHECDYSEIILEGSQQVTRQWHHAGDIRIATAGTAYGPLIAGPEGCKVLVIFKDGRWPALSLSKGDSEGLHVDVLLRDLA